MSILTEMDNRNGFGCFKCILSATQTATDGLGPELFGLSGFGHELFV